jgi:hypothetical protein
MLRYGLTLKFGVPSWSSTKKRLLVYEIAEINIPIHHDAFIIHDALHLTFIAYNAFPLVGSQNYPLGLNHTRDIIASSLTVKRISRSSIIVRSCISMSVFGMFATPYESLKIHYTTGQI